MTQPSGRLTLLAIDPGRAKCGLAVVTGPDPISSHAQAVVETSHLLVEVAKLLRRFPEVNLLLIGGGTGSVPLRKALQSGFSRIPLKTIDEYGTSLRARRRFVTEHPASGWRRLLPSGLRTPERPYDDYVALLLAEDYFQNPF